MTMRRRLLFTVLVLPLVLITLMPVSAVAKPDKALSPVEQFAATAQVVVTDPGKSILQGSRITTRGEMIEGVFSTVQNWPALEGASLSVRHNSVITLSPPGEDGVGFFQGNATALVTVSPLSGGRLFGRYTATLEGEYTFTGDGQLVILWVLDTGTFKIIGRILDVDGHTIVKASGEWNATLLLTQVGPYFTLAGMAQVSGAYETIAHSDHNADDN